LSEGTILFLNQSSGYLMIDIINAHRDKYKNRILLTGLLNPRNTPLDEAVKVHRLIKYNRSSPLKRIWTWGIGFVQALFLILTKYRKAHLFLVSNPPIGTLLPLFCRNSYSLLIYDVYPDALVEYKIFRPGSWFIKWWKKANHRIYQKAQRVYTLSDGMKQLMLEYSSEDSIKVVPVWTDNRFFKAIEKKHNPFVKEQKLEGKFIILYSGNLGKSHSLEVLVDLAKTTKDVDIFYLIIGGGDQYDNIKQKINESGLNNIRLLPWQPTENLPFTLAAADIGVVSLGAEASKLSLPSKTFNLMSVGAPILAIAEKHSALAKLVREKKIGASFTADQIASIFSFIEAIKNNNLYRNELVENAKRASKEYGPENALKFL
jgi:glycosyltransferase involved in cell wall biosynthesis